MAQRMQPNPSLHRRRPPRPRPEAAATDVKPTAEDANTAWATWEGKRAVAFVALDDYDRIVSQLRRADLRAHAKAQGFPNVHAMTMPQLRQLLGVKEPVYGIVPAAVPTKETEHGH